MIEAVSLTFEERLRVIAYLQAAGAPDALVARFEPKQDTPIRSQAMRLIEAAMVDKDLTDYTRVGMGALVLLTDEQLAAELYALVGDTENSTDLQQAVSDALQVIDDPEDR